MALKTPFFKAFGPLLFGRGKTSTLRALRELESLEDLYAIFGELFVERFLGPSAKGVNSRRRRLSMQVTFWAFVAQALSPKGKKGTGMFSCLAFPRSHVVLGGVTWRATASTSAAPRATWERGDSPTVIDRRDRAIKPLTYLDMWMCNIEANVFPRALANVA